MFRIGNRIGFIDWNFLMWFLFFLVETRHALSLRAPRNVTKKNVNVFLMISIGHDWIRYAHPAKLRFENDYNKKKRSSKLGVIFCCNHLFVTSTGFKPVTS